VLFKINTVLPSLSLSCALAKQINWFRNRKSQTKGVGGGGQSLSHINSIQSDIKHIQFSLATQELYNQWLASEQNPPAPRICHLNPPKAPGLNPLESWVSGWRGNKMRQARCNTITYFAGTHRQAGAGRQGRQGRRLTEMNYVCL